MLHYTAHLIPARNGQPYGEVRCNGAYYCTTDWFGGALNKAAQLNEEEARSCRPERIAQEIADLDFICSVCK